MDRSEKRPSSLRQNFDIMPLLLDAEMLRRQAGVEIVRWKPWCKRLGVPCDCRGTADRVAYIVRVFCAHTFVGPVWVVYVELPYHEGGLFVLEESVMRKDGPRVRSKNGVLWQLTSDWVWRRTCGGASEFTTDL